MKNQKGFIQIPLLIAIIAGVLVLGGGGYFGVRQYQSYQVEKIEKERIAQEKEQQTQKLFSEQSETIEKAQKEIQGLKQGAEQTNTKISQQNQQTEKIAQQLQLEKGQATTKSDENTISAKEIDPYLEGVPLVQCGVTSGYCEDSEGRKISCLQPKTTGSGSLWNLPDIGGYALLTNNHVVTAQRCNLDKAYESKSGSVMLPHILRTEKTTFNAYTDIGLFKIHQDEMGFGLQNAFTPKDLNYQIGTLPRCSSKMLVGNPVITVGFPAFGVKEDTYNQGRTGTWSLRYNRIVSNGIISGYDNSVGPLPYPNYFVSAKIDSGNSGGIAFSKDKNGLCVLGVPTWLTIGNYETQGLVQNINNIFYGQ